MLKIAICEDCAQDATALRQLVEEYLHEQGLEGEIDSYESGEALLSAYCPGLYHIAFLDIYLGGLTGMQLAHQLRAQDPELMIIFLTVSETHSIESYAVRAVHYLLKPVTYPQLSEALRRCGAVLDEHARRLEVFSGRSRIKVRLQDIFYIEASPRGSVMSANGEEIKTSMTMERLESLLSGGSFVRCHRGFIVNMRKIHRLSEKAIVLASGAQIPVGRAYTERFKQEYARFALALARSRQMGATAGKYVEEKNLQKAAP